MNVELHCSGCGKLIRAPGEAAGRWADCPACGRRLYIPTPAAELDEIPLSPEDTQFLQNEAALQAERHALDRVVNRERPARDGDSSSSSSEQARSPADVTDIAFWATSRPFRGRTWRARIAS